MSQLKTVEMNSEKEAETLDKIFIRIKSGWTLKKALSANDLNEWFYKTLTDA